MDLFEKCRQFTIARIAMSEGIYPYFHPLESSQGPEVTVEGRRMIMVGSNDYLGLTNHPRVEEAAIEAIRRYGTGCAGSRFLNGTLAIHEELEERLARFFRREAAIVFPTGFQTNLGVLSALVEKDHVVVIDKMDHASIYDGCRLSFGYVRKFRHNDVRDLDRILREETPRGALVVVDGVFSVEGDIAKLPGIVAVCYSHGARLMVDDAHGIGVLGAEGRGTLEHFHLTGQVDILVGTFSKSLASVGGFLAARESVIHYLKHHARPLIFSASLPPASAAAVLAALEVLESEPERRERLWANTRKMMKGLREMGFDIGPTETPIVPVVVGEDLQVLRMWRLMWDEGVFVTPFVSPAVPAGRALFRTIYTAAHTSKQLDRVLEVFAKVGKEMGLIP